MSTELYCRDCYREVVLGKHLSTYKCYTCNELFDVKVVLTKSQLELILAKTRNTKNERRCYDNDTNSTR